MAVAKLSVAQLVCRPDDRTRLVPRYQQRTQTTAEISDNSTHSIVFVRANVTLITNAKYHFACTP